MDEKKLIGLLPMMTSSLASMIAERDNICEDEAISKLYNSMLYSMLEKENTKVWQFSITKLFELYQEELKTGLIDFPEY